MATQRVMLLPLLLTLCLINLSAGKIQTWISPRTRVGTVGGPLKVQCYFSGADPARHLTVGMLKVIPDSTMGNPVNSFQGSVTEDSVTNGKVVFTIAALVLEDAGKYACMAVQSPPVEGQSFEYHTAFVTVKVISPDDQSHDSPGPVPDSVFSAQAVEKNIVVTSGESLHVECMFAGAEPESVITATLLKQSVPGRFDDSSHSLSQLELSPVIDGSGQAKWSSENMALSDSGIYSCIFIKAQVNGEDSHQIQTVSDSFKLTVEEYDEDEYWGEGDEDELSTEQRELLLLGE
ncbi:hypothetical protein [Rhinolophus gammaherpesvirus 1]|uniref:Ig-like domain-containing protein n=1 Tax=Rhinolophus gammaherpesvirus 1 TaxID=2054179 RepID=A0A2Z5U625_9GAMA|nr:hypothetical protein [Rhinolophus gammaherpesvirus 1]BBB06448.1 hypothetical protein [Rhinolophus gammaherpesvirus 1]